MLLMTSVYCWEEGMLVHHCRGGEELSPLGLYTAVGFIRCVHVEGIKVFEGNLETLTHN